MLTKNTILVFQFIYCLTTKFNIFKLTVATARYILQNHSSTSYDNYFT